MIAKTVTSNDFSGALEYGVGLQADRTNKQADLLSVANVYTRRPLRVDPEISGLPSAQFLCQW
jgi:hypothetical protein